MAGIVDKVCCRQVFSNTMSSYNNPNAENRDFTIDCILVRLFKLSLGNFDSKCSEMHCVNIGGFHAILGDTINNGEMNKCWWTNKTT